MSMQLIQTNVQQNKEGVSQMAGAEKDAAIRLGAYTALSGAASFVIGAILWLISGTDIDLAATNGTMADYLTAAAAARSILVANLTFWIVGAILLGIAGTTLSTLSGRKPNLARAAAICYRTAVPLVIVAYMAMLAVIVQIAPDTSETAVSIAEVVAWIGSRTDWVATILIIGIGPLFISLTGQDDWVPTWLLRLGYLNGFCGLLTTIALYANGLGTYGFIIIPIGLIWMFSAGIVLLRKTSKAS